jgi:hypothetical protein
MTKFTVIVDGIGTETVVGTISQEQYDYWKGRPEGDFEAYCWDSEAEIEVAEYGRIFSEGEWYECDDMK